MDKEVWKKVLSLISRTGDRMVVVDPDMSEPYIVMDVGSYTEIIDAIAEAEQAFDLDDGFLPPPSMPEPSAPTPTPAPEPERLTKDPDLGKLNTANVQDTAPEKNGKNWINGAKSIPHISSVWAPPPEPKFFTEPNP